VHRSLPVYPDQQTLRVTVGMSQRCQNATSLLKAGPFLLAPL
jgi:hypothetical protein